MQKIGCDTIKVWASSGMIDSPQVEKHSQEIANGTI
jgi:hypothetical protein